MRYSQREEIRFSLVDRRPNQPTEKSEDKEYRVWQMNNSKKESDEKHTFPTPAKNDLTAPVQVTLQSILLEECPERNQQESPTQWARREVLRQPRNKNDQRHGDDGG